MGSFRATLMLRALTHDHVLAPALRISWHALTCDHVLAPCTQDLKRCWPLHSGSHGTLSPVIMCWPLHFGFNTVAKLSSADAPTKQRSRST
eukprot:1153171-Pelagomonas_calceolata.AAC.4